MTRRQGWWKRCCLGWTCLGWACLIIAGCGREGGKQTAADKTDDGDFELPAVKVYSLAELPIDWDSSVFPQDQGRIKPLCPKGWSWSALDKDAFLGFYRKGASLRVLPRITVAGENSPIPDFPELTSANLGDFIIQLRSHLDTSNCVTPPTPAILGDTPCAAYVEVRPGRSGQFARLVLKTVLKGRLYTVSLDVREEEFPKYRNAAYAVAASLSSPERPE